MLRKCKKFPGCIFLIFDELYPNYHPIGCMKKWIWRVLSRYALNLKKVRNKLNFSWFGKKDIIFVLFPGLRRPASLH